MSRTIARRRLPVAILLAALGGSVPAQPPRPPGAAAPQAELPTWITARPLQPAPDDDELRKLLKERYNAALREVQARFREIQAGNHRLDPHVLSEAAQRLLDAEVELADKPEERLRVHQRRVDLAKEQERLLQHQYDAGRIAEADLARARYERVSAEITLLKAKRQLGTGKPK